MIKLAVLISLVIMSTLSFASTTSLNELSSAFKATQTAKLQPGHDINIVYGGEDVSHKVTLLATSATA